MKNKIIFISLCLIIASILNVSAQKSLPPLSFKNVGNIKLYIAKYYKPDERFIANACINSVIFIKFKVNVSNQIEALDMSKNGPSEIKEALKKAILATDGFWELSEEEKKAAESKTFILPFIFYYQGGCSSSLLTSPQNKSITDPLLEYINMDKGMHDSINNMLEFETSSSTLLDCTLISPMIVSIQT